MAEECSRALYGDPITALVTPASTKTYFKRVAERVRDKSTHDVIRMCQAFKISGGSSNIPSWRIKQFLMTRGYGAFSPYEGKLYFWGTGEPGGQWDAFYLPTVYTFANAYTGASGSLKIGEDCVFARNDHLCQGLLPILDRYNILLSHNELSLYMAMVNTRAQNIGVAGRDAEAKAWDMVFDSLEDGQIKALVDRNMLNKVMSLSNQGQTGMLKDLVELEQYIRATKQNELGLNMNWNAKRESLSDSESLMNEDSLMPMLEDMLECWQEWADKVNEKYSEYLDLGPYKIEFANAWLNNELSQNAEADVLEDSGIDDKSPEESDPEDPSDSDAEGAEDPSDDKDDEEEDEDETD